jgi:hypothetical protein
MKLTNTEIDILQALIQKRLNEIDNGPEGTEIHFKPEILQKIKKKLEKMLFE